MLTARIVTVLHQSWCYFRYSDANCEERIEIILEKTAIILLNSSGDERSLCRRIVLGETGKNILEIIHLYSGLYIVNQNLFKGCGCTIRKRNLHCLLVLAIYFHTQNFPIIIL